MIGLRTAPTPSCETDASPNYHPIRTQSRLEDRFHLARDTRLWRCLALIVHNSQSVENLCRQRHLTWI
jgi:hypothetical protein